MRYCDKTGKHLVHCFALVLGATTTVSCRSSEAPAHGTVTVDGEPLDAGTIHFQSIDQTGKSLGTTINQGQFEVSPGMKPGRYRVQVEGFRKSGRMIMDQQRGQIEEMVQLRFQNISLEVDVTAENAGDLRIELKRAT